MLQSTAAAAAVSPQEEARLELGWEMARGPGKVPVLGAEAEADGATEEPPWAAAWAVAAAAAAAEAQAEGVEATVAWAVAWVMALSVAETASEAVALVAALAVPDSAVA